MKYIITVILIGIQLNIVGQDYDDAGVIFELLGEHATMKEFFGRNDSSFKVTQYKLNEINNSHEATGGCVFSFLENDVIQTRVFKKNSKVGKIEYWKWTKNERGDKFGYIEASDKKGKLKKYNTMVSNFKQKIINKDTVDQITFSTEKGDTTCMFLDRWIYR